MTENINQPIKIIDRSQPPRNMPLPEMVWPGVEHHLIEWAGGHIPVDLIEGGGHDLVRIEWQFPAGSWHESKPLLASLTNRMLQEGSVGHNSKQIAEKLDYYGAYLHHEGGVHRSMVGVYSLGKHLEAVLPLVWELIFQPTFPEHELMTTIQNRLQELSVSRNKVSVLSRNRLMGLLFGEQHPYGYSTREEDLLSVTAQDLHAFHQQFYTVDGLRLVVAGGHTHEAFRKLQRSCPTSLPQGTSASGGIHPAPSGGIYPASHPPLESAPHSGNLPNWQRVEKAEATQHALRLGRTAPTRTHPDYPALEVLITLLGGYFGSRLMKNLREDKGYTYGVGAALHSRLMSGWISISTEVGAAVDLDARSEIIHEMNRLCDELVTPEELNRVRAYLEGSLRSAFEGPFSPADRLSDVQVFGLDFSYYQRYLEVLRNIQATQLKELAATYLRPDTFIAVVAGGTATD
jgi:zinc protease